MADNIVNKIRAMSTSIRNNESDIENLVIRKMSLRNILFHSDSVRPQPASFYEKAQPCKFVKMHINRMNIYN